MSPLSRLALPAALALAGCAPSAEEEPETGVMANFTEGIDRRAAEEKAGAVRDADARSADRAERAVERIAESGRARRQAE